jgi:beta-galactosidase
MELWNGKAQHWGEPIIRRDTDEVRESVRTALESAELVNLYMFHGGTSFGFMNGTLDFGESLVVQMTSYDVDAPLDEYGRRTPKYYAERDVITKALGNTPALTATDTTLFEYTDYKYIGASSLKKATKKTSSPAVLTMEECDTGYGYIVYKTKIFASEKGAELILPEVHDIAHIYIDGEYKKTVKRHDKDKSYLISKGGEMTLAVLVENMGRINYGVRLEDRKGLVGDIVLHDLEYNVFIKPMGYEIYSLELDTLPKEFTDVPEINAPAFYKYTLNAEKPMDTVMHLEGFTRGVAFINGFNLGRHWAIEHSPNKLFIPAPLLKEGKNEIVIFDVLATETDKKIRFGE